MLRKAIREHRLGYVMQIAANRPVPTHAAPIRVGELAATLPDGVAALHLRAGQQRPALLQLGLDRVARRGFHLSTLLWGPRYAGPVPG